MVLAKKPPMGWNSWNTFGKEINEQLIFEMVDVMARDGYLEAGYEYVIIDDGWQADFRAQDGHLMFDEERFPHGMKAVGDYIHSKGLKFGLYSAAGVKTCLGKPGSYGYEFVDAQDFADWGVDYLKYDICHFSGNANVISAYFTMSMALKTTKRDIVYSVASCGEGNPSKWARAIGGHLYRSTPDIQDCFESFRRIALEQLDNLSESAPNCYNDMDMITVGMHGKGYAANGGCTIDEYRIQFGLWCMYGAPLILGTDLRTIDKETKHLLTNKNLLKINQDEEQRFPYFERNSRYANKNKLILFKLLEDNKFVLGMFNLTENDGKLDCYFTDIGLPAYSGKSLKLKNVFTGEESEHKDFLTVYLQKHTCAIWLAEIK